MNKADDAALRTHTVDAAEMLEVLTGAKARAFAYPYCTHDEWARQAVESAGFAVAFAVGREAGRFAADRVFVRGDEPAIVFRWKLSAAYRQLSGIAGRVSRLRRAVRTAVRVLRAFDRSIAGRAR
jgi:hypothetical protein